VITVDAAFEEFRIEVFDRAGGLFVRNGTTEERLQFELPLSEIQDVYEDMSLRARGANVRSSMRFDDPARDMGVQLFTALSKTTPGRIFHERNARAQRQERGLRIRIALHGSKVEQLPWELLCDPVWNSFVALVRGIAIVRSVPLQAPVVVPSLTGPVKVTVLTADVTGELETNRDVAMLRKVMERSGYLLSVHEAVDGNDVFKALSQPADVLYFAGTGAASIGPPGFPLSQSLAIFESSKRLGAWVAFEGNQLARAAAGAGVRLAILAACHSDMVARQLAEAGVAASVGFRGSVGIAELVDLTSALCRSVVAGEPFETAMCDARHSIDLGSPGSLLWGLATAYLQAPDGALFPAAPAVLPPLTAMPIPPPSSNVGDKEWHALAKRKALYEQQLETLKRRIEDQSLAGFTVPELQTELDQLEARLADMKTKLEAASTRSS
jgi:hypothetical protein